MSLENDSLQHLISFVSSHSPTSLPSLDSVLSSDGQTATLNGVTYSAEVKHNILLRNEKTLNSSLASLIILLLLGDPANVSYVVYRKTCVDHGVKDPIKVVDRPAVWETFFRDAGISSDKGVGVATATATATAASTTTATTAPMDQDEPLERMNKLAQESRDDKMTQDSETQRDSQDNNKKRSKETTTVHEDMPKKHRKESSDRKEHRRSQESSTRPSSSKHASASSKMDEAAKKGKKEKGPMTQEDLFKNLKTVVDKREIQSEVVGNLHTDSATIHRQDGLHSEDSISQVQYTKDLILVDEYHQSKAVAKEDEYTTIKICLSSLGYGAEDIPKDVLDRDRIEVEKIMSFEIPVGTSATVLQCGSGVSALLTSDGGLTNLGKSGLQVTQKKKDFSMVLDMYNDSIKADEKQRRHGDKNHPSTSSRPSLGSSMTTTAAGSSHFKPRPKAQGKPIIIVPNAMTSPVTLVNASLFFEKSSFMSRDVMLKENPGARKPSGMINISRRISPRLGGGLVEYEIIDNPSMKLSKDDWDRVVAVVAQGASWQFKGWKMKPTAGSSEISPVDVFSRCFGFFIGFEGSPVPQEVTGWNVKKGMLSKDKRGMDSVVVASFWNGLDEWMSVHKPEYLPLEES